MLKKAFAVRTALNARATTTTTVQRQCAFQSATRERATTSREHVDHPIAIQHQPDYDYYQAVRPSSSSQYPSITIPFDTNFDRPGTPIKVQTAVDKNTKGYGFRYQTMWWTDKHADDLIIQTVFGGDTHAIQAHKGVICLPCPSAETGLLLDRLLSEGVRRCVVLTPKTAPQKLFKTKTIKDLMLAHSATMNNKQWNVTATTNFYRLQLKHVMDTRLNCAELFPDVCSDNMLWMCDHNGKMLYTNKSASRLTFIGCVSTDVVARVFMHNLIDGALAHLTGWMLNTQERSMFHCAPVQFVVFVNSLGHAMMTNCVQLRRSSARRTAVWMHMFQKLFEVTTIGSDHRFSMSSFVNVPKDTAEPAVNSKERIQKRLISTGYTPDQMYILNIRQRQHITIAGHILSHNDVGSVCLKLQFYLLYIALTSAETTIRNALVPMYGCEEDVCEALSSLSIPASTKLKDISWTMHESIFWCTLREHLQNLSAYEHDGHEPVRMTGGDCVQQQFEKYFFMKIYPHPKFPDEVVDGASAQRVDTV